VTVRISYAQNGEDVRAWRALRDVSGQKVYVEVGASDPFDDSTTAALSADGWRGVLFEPDLATAQRLREARPRDVVVAAAVSDRRTVLHYDPGTDRGLGSVGGASAERTVTVPALTLGEALDDVLSPDAGWDGPREVHFMSVDVEGHEAAVLRGAGFDRWRPWVLAVEATRPNSREQDFAEWDPLVTGAGYRYVATDGLNRWYVADEHADLAESVAQPFNVLDGMLDGWRRRAEVELGAAVEELAADRDRLAGELSVVRRDLDLLRQDCDAERLQRSQAEARAARAEEELALHAAQLQAVQAREAVLLGSKSWQLTAPLRTLRWRAGLALAQRASGAAVLPVPAPASRPGDDRRWEALRARLDAARSRTGR
jgi:FkbM family methyltransferase